MATCIEIDEVKEINQYIKVLNKTLKEAKIRKKILIKEQKERKTKAIINDILAKFRKFGIGYKQLITKTRKQEVVYLRSFFIYFLHEKMSINQISKEIEFGRDAVRNSISIVENLKLTKDNKYYNAFNLLAK